MLALHPLAGLGSIVRPARRRIRRALPVRSLLPVALLAVAATATGSSAQTATSHTGEQAAPVVFNPDARPGRPTPRPARPGDVPREKAEFWQKAMDRARRLPLRPTIGAPARTAQSAGAPAPAASSLGPVAWKQVAPGPGTYPDLGNPSVQPKWTGIVIDIAVSPVDPNTILIATLNGGVWKTTNLGGTWRPTMSGLPSLSMGAVTYHRGNPNIVFAGTGTADDPGWLYPKGAGLYWSIDGGETWTHYRASSNGGVLNGKRIRRVVALATDEVLVSTTDGLYYGRPRVPGTPDFTRVNLGSVAPDGSITPLGPLDGDVTDLDVDVDGKTIWASAVRSDAPRLYRSILGSPTLLEPISVPGTSAAYVQFAQASGGYPVYVTVAENRNYDRTRVYAAQQPPPGGAPYTFAEVQVLPYQYNPGPAGYPIPLYLAVDPANSSYLYANAFPDFMYSADGGVTWSRSPASRTEVHVDGRSPVVFYLPSGGGLTAFFVGTDGGFSLMGAGGVAGVNLNNGLSTQLVFGLDIGRGSPAANEVTVVGLQDNAIPVVINGEWRAYIGGDGYTVSIDPRDESRILGMSAFPMKTVYSADGGRSWVDIPPSPADGLGYFARGYEFDPRNAGGPLTVRSPIGTYAYGAFLVSGATQLRRIFLPDPSTQRPGLGVTPTHSLVKAFTGTPSTYAATFGATSERHWIGMDDGSVVRYDPAASPDTQVHTPVAGRKVTGIAVNPNDPNDVVAVYGGVCGAACVGSSSQHVFRTLDGGQTWTDIGGTGTSSLPDIGVWSVSFGPVWASPMPIIIGTDTGVLISDAPNTWARLGVGLPTVTTTAVAVDHQASPLVLRVGTYGRGVFELRSSPELVVESNLAAGQVDVGKTQQISFSITNADTNPITYNQALTHLTGAPNFAVYQGPVTLQPGQTVFEKVNFTPTASGVSTATITLAPLGAPVIVVRVSGEGLSPPPPAPSPATRPVGAKPPRRSSPRGSARPR